MDSELNSLQPEMVAMANEILESYSYGDMENISLEIAEVYNWCRDLITKMKTKGLLAELNKEASGPDKKRVQRLKRQREILGITGRKLSAGIQELNGIKF